MVIVFNIPLKKTVKVPPLIIKNKRVVVINVGLEPSRENLVKEELNKGVLVINMTNVFDKDNILL